MFLSNLVERIRFIFGQIQIWSRTLEAQNFRGSEAKVKTLGPVAYAESDSEGSHMIGLTVESILVEGFLAR